MIKTLKGLGFVVLGLAVVTVGLPALVLGLSFLGMLIGAYVFPALIVLALLRTLFWDFPRALKYRTVNGEWPIGDSEESRAMRREVQSITKRIRQNNLRHLDTTPWD